MNPRIRGVLLDIPVSAEGLCDMYRARHIEAGSRSLGAYGEHEFMPNWMSKSYQRATFNLVSRLGIPADAGVVDVGCGYGCLLEHLRGTGWRGRYLGIDLVPEFIETARSRFPADPDAAFLAADYLDPGNDPVLSGYDYHIASSLFGIAYTPSLLEDVIARAARLSRRGVLATCNSDLYRVIASDAIAYPPSRLLGIGLSLAPELTLLHTAVPVENIAYSLVGLKIEHS